MADVYNAKVTVISQKGHCAAGHKVGDQWELGIKVPEGLCGFAVHSLLHIAEVLQFGGSFPWEADPDVAKVACPDADNPVVFEIRRLRA